MEAKGSSSHFNFEGESASFSVDVAPGEDPSSYKVSTDGRTLTIRVLSSDGAGNLTVSIGSKVLHGTVIRSSGDSIQIILEGERFGFNLRRPSSAPGPISQLRRKATQPVDPGIVVSQIPGRVIMVRVKKGDRIQKGESLVVLEAMKMETNIRSHADGVVREVSISPGASVTRGQILLSLEIGEG